MNAESHALVFVAPPDDKPAYREALMMLGRVALSRKLPPPQVLSGWESAQWFYERIDGELRQDAAAAVAELPVDWALVPVASPHGVVCFTIAQQISPANGSLATSAPSRSSRLLNDSSFPPSCWRDASPASPRST